MSEEKEEKEGKGRANMVVSSASSDTRLEPEPITNSLLSRRRAAGGVPCVNA